LGSSVTSALVTSSFRPNRARLTVGANVPARSSVTSASLSSAIDGVEFPPR
jgi:hypothetical protein